MRRMGMGSPIAMPSCLLLGMFLCVYVMLSMTGCIADDSVRIEPPSEEDSHFYDMGQTIEVEAIDWQHPDSKPSVSFTLDGCSVYEENLPEEVELSEVVDYVVSEEGIGEGGSLPQGVCFVKADITYENESNRDVVVGVNNVRLGFFGLDSNETPPAHELCWMDGVVCANAPDDAFMPTLSAHCSQSYSIGFIVSSRFVENGSARLVVQSEIRGLEQKNILGFNIPKGV